MNIFLIQCTKKRKITDVKQKNFIVNLKIGYQPKWLKENTKK